MDIICFSIQRQVFIYFKKKKNLLKDLQDMKANCQEIKPHRCHIKRGAITLLSSLLVKIFNAMTWEYRIK